MRGGPISAIVCIGGETRFLAGALESITGQSRPVDEIIVVHTSDVDRRLFGILDRFPIDRVAAQPASGLAAARNHGIELSSGDIITFLDADDAWLPAKTELQEARLTGSGGAVAGYLRRFRERSAAEGDYPAGFFENTHPAVTPGGVMATRTAVRRTGPFDTEFKIACDHEWIMRLRGTVGIEMIEHLVLSKRIHPRSLSHSGVEYRREIMTLLQGRQAG